MKKRATEKMWIVHLGTYPPRECGIATFTADLIKNFDELFAVHEETKVVAMNIEQDKVPAYPDNVLFQISENNGEEYRDVAHKLNEMPQVKIISVQHEFGIFGNNHGKNFLIFLEEIRKPIMVTLHTVLPRPSEEMREVMLGIITKADRLIVMTVAAKLLLETVYGAHPDTVKVIPHGIHPLPYTESNDKKQILHLQGHRILSTFGLLSRGKGIEYALTALPDIVKKYPDTLYLIIGATHPVVAAREGEVYRNELKELVKQYTLEKNVVFYDQYFSVEELLSFLQATDIYLSLSQNPDQAVSGTLSYALGAGRPVISTAFMQAREIITSDVGALIGFHDSENISKQVVSLFEDDPRRSAMGKTAYFRTRGMIWPNIALSYMREFIALSNDIAQREKSIPPINLAHMRKLTDDFGIFQFAVLDKPDPTWGYTLDDNARALVAMAWCTSHTEKTTVPLLAETYVKFLEKSARADGRFENYFTKEKIPHHERNTTENLDDANARAMWALSECVTSDLPLEIRNRASSLFKKQSPYHSALSSPRAAGFYIKAIALWLSIHNDQSLREQLVRYADFLVSLFKDHVSAEWQWFEPIMTYSNAVLPEALLYAYTVTKNEEYVSVAQQSLDFLLVHSMEGEMTMPIGQAGWFQRGGVKGLYDQQAEEVSSLVLALRTMYEHTKDTRYLEKMNQVFQWFLGNNALNQMVYSQMTGGCYDGLSAREVNLNQGAESTISYLLARLAIDEI